MYNYAIVRGADNPLAEKAVKIRMLLKQTTGRFLRKLYASSCMRKSLSEPGEGEF